MLEEQITAWLQACGAEPGACAAPGSADANTITSPPVTDSEGHTYPLGRTLTIQTSDDGGDQDEEIPAQHASSIKLDISWLAEPCIHDAITFLPADTPAGFRAALPSPKAARLLLERTLLEGNPDALVLKGTPWASTVSRMLEEIAFSEESLRIDAAIDAIKEQLQAELGLQSGDIVELPALFVAGVAIMANPVNCLVCNGRVLMPAPNGPVINGTDVFAAAIRHKVGLPEEHLQFIEVSEGYNFRTQGS
jgi:protein-arginine deiminase